VKLVLATDLEDTSWLAYVLEEFRIIQNASFEIMISRLEHTSSELPTIYYHASSTTSPKHCIPNRSSVYSKTLISVDNHIFIFKDTQSEDPGLLINYDILWNSFLFISRYWEYKTELSGKLINSYFNNHPLHDTWPVQVPIVNIYFNILQSLIQNTFPELNFGQSKTPQIELSHDLDYIDKTVQLRIKQSAFHAYNALKSLPHIGRFFGNVRKLTRFLFTTPGYWNFDYWQNTEDRYRKTSVFYVFVRTNGRTLKQWLLDPSYDIRTNTSLVKTLKGLKAKGWEIGLHGSFASARDTQLLKEEKQTLEKALGCNIEKTRQHWLQYFETVTPDTHQQLFQFDSTLGWNDHPGFRSGICSRYRPYDFKNKRRYNYWVTPQVLMDSHLYDYADNTENRLAAAKEMLKSLKGYSNSYVSISWHPRTASPDYGWNRSYEELLQFCAHEDLL